MPAKFLYRLRRIAAGRVDASTRLTGRNIADIDGRHGAPMQGRALFSADIRLVTPSAYASAALAPRKYAAPWPAELPHLASSWPGGRIYFHYGENGTTAFSNTGFQVGMRVSIRADMGLIRC